VKPSSPELPADQVRVRVDGRKLRYPPRKPFY
jgi:hypothetical protein